MTIIWPSGLIFDPCFPPDPPAPLIPVARRGLGGGGAAPGDLVSFAFYMQALFTSFSAIGEIYTGALPLLPPGTPLHRGDPPPTPHRHRSVTVCGLQQTSPFTQSTVSIPATVKACQGYPPPATPFSLQSMGVPTFKNIRCFFGACHQFINHLFEVVCCPYCRHLFVSHWIDEGH